MGDAQEVSVGDKGEGQNALSKIEVFGLVTGIVGLVADAIGLITFAAGVWGFTRDEGSGASGDGLFVIVTGLLLFYGWFVLAWIITVRNLKRYSLPPLKDNIKSAGACATIGVGLLLTPLAFIWLSIAFLGNSALSSEVLPTTIAVTSTPLVNQTSIHSTSTSISEAIDSAFCIGFVVIILYPFVGMGVFGCMAFLMPLVYDDSVEHNVRVATTEHNERVRAYIEDHWDDLEERISIEFELYNWIEVSDLQDLADLLDVPLKSIEIVFAKYALIHPTKVEYGYLYNDKGYKLSRWKVLVNSSLDPKDKHIGAL
jgi:hypothetical protein